MEEPRWEYLQKDCLVNILGRVGMESLLLDIPFVCKSWYKATLDPLCWRDLDFHNISLNEFNQSIGDVPFRLMEECKLVDESSIYAFTKFVIKRRGKKAFLLKLPSLCDTEDILSFAANECPDIKMLILPRHLGLGHLGWNLPPDFISKLKKLESIVVPGQLDLKDIVNQIGMHCKNFIFLMVQRAGIWKDKAQAIATHLPNLKYLVLRNANIDKDSLGIILQGCRQLHLFDCTNCIGFNEDDEDIKKLAALIPQLIVTGCMDYSSEITLGNESGDYFNEIVASALEELGPALVDGIPELDVADGFLLEYW